MYDTRQGPYFLAGTHLGAWEKFEGSKWRPQVASTGQYASQDFLRHRDLDPRTGARNGNPIRVSTFNPQNGRCIDSYVLF